MAQHAKDVARSRSGPVVDSSIFQVRLAHACFLYQRNHTSLVHGHNPLSDHHLLRPLVSAVIESKGQLKPASASLLAHQTKRRDRQACDKLLQRAHTLVVLYAVGLRFYFSVISVPRSYNI
jgi:hypothetical protein